MQLRDRNALDSGDIIDINTNMFDSVKVWSEVPALGIYAAKGFTDGQARWGFGETPEAAVTDLLQELCYKRVTSYGDLPAPKSSLDGPLSVSREQTEKLIPKEWIDSAAVWARNVIEAAGFRAADVPDGTVIRMKNQGDMDGWVYEKFSKDRWHTTKLDTDYPDSFVQTEMNDDGFDILYIPKESS